MRTNAAEKETSFVETNCPEQSSGNEAGLRPEISKIQMINERFIEIHWNQPVQNADVEAYFSVTVNGEPVGLKDPEEEEKGIVYYDHQDRHMTTLSMDREVDPENLPEIKVSVQGGVISGEDGKTAEAVTLTVTKYAPFYTYIKPSKSGVLVKGSYAAMPEAVDKAVEFLDTMLTDPDIIENLKKNGSFLAVYGKGQIAYDVPEHRLYYSTSGLYVEGFGGRIASITDVNVLRHLKEDYPDWCTRYVYENILVHEFGHTMKLFGFSQKQEKEFMEIYSRSVETKKLYPNSYMGSNSDEYWATLCTIWFSVMAEGKAGFGWDGVRGPINTREELKIYDKEAYDFMGTIFTDGWLPEPWNIPMPNNYNVTDPSQVVSYKEYEK